MNKNTISSPVTTRLATLLSETFLGLNDQNTQRFKKRVIKASEKLALRYAKLLTKQEKEYRKKAKKAAKQAAKTAVLAVKEKKSKPEPLKTGLVTNPKKANQKHGKRKGLPSQEKQPSRLVTS